MMKLRKNKLHIIISVFLSFMISMQTVSANELFRLSSEASNAFDIVFAIDNSREMYNYDYSADNTWLEAFYGVMEQAYPNSRFSVLSHNGASEFTDMYTAENALYEIPLYQGEANPIDLLQAAENTLRSSTNQKMVVFSSPMCYNNSELKNKTDELSEEGVLVYIVAFEKDSNKAEEIKSAYENVIVCSNTHEVSIRMADLYEYLVCSPQTYSLTNSAAETYKSAFRMGKHNYSFSQNRYKGGSYLVQLLNMYYLFPTFTDGYGPLDYGQCVEASRGNTYKMFHNTNSAAQTFEFWNNIVDELLANNYYSTYQAASEELSLVVEEKIKKNLKRRYPVLVKAGTQSYFLITGLENGNYYVNGTKEIADLYSQPVRVLDTELYMQAILETYEIGDDLTFYGNTPTIKITLPTGGADYYDSYYNSVSTTTDTLLQITRSNSEFVISIQTEFTGVLPNCHRTNRYYNINIFSDITNNLWSKEYIFDMLNRGVVRGYEDYSFKPNGQTTMAEFLAMMINAADITISTDVPEGETWAYPYINYAQTKGWWPSGYVYQNNPQDEASPIYTSFSELLEEDEYLPPIDNITRHGYDNQITREFAFYLLWKVAMSEECRTPNHLIDYPNSSAAAKFLDSSQISGCFIDEINNLTENNAIVGDGTNHLNPQKQITRGEICRILSFAMFGFDKKGDFKYPVVEEKQINEMSLNGTGTTSVSGRTNEYRESLHTFTVEPEKTGLYKFSLTDNSDGRLEINVYDEKFRQMEEVSNRAGYYRLMGNAKYYISVHGFANVSYTLQIGERITDNTQFSITNLRYNDNEGPMLGYGNKMQFSISKDTAERETYYVVPALGWTEDNLYERDGQTITLSGTNGNTVTFDNIDLTSGGHSKLYTKINVYTDDTKRTKVSSLYAVGIDRSNKPMPSDMEMKKKVGGSFLYVNSPETLIDEDIIKVRSINEERNKLIYQQENVSGKNNLYITHSLRGGNLTDDVMYDIDFFNPTDEAVKIELTKPYYYDEAKYPNSNKYYSIRNTYEKRLLNENEKITVTIPKNDDGGHKLLFKDILHEQIAYNKSHSYIAIFVDFEVLDNKSITVSTLAAYKETPQFLDLLTWEGKTYANVSYPVERGDCIIDKRAGEYEVHRKYLGIDRTGFGEIESYLSYVVDDNIAPQDLNINLKDNFFSNGITNPKSSWITNINPINDRYNAGYKALPSSLHSFEYTDSKGIWNFDFRFLNPKSILESTPQTIKDTTKISGYVNPILNDTALNYYQTAAINDKTRVPYPAMDFSDPITGNETYQTWEDYTMVMGSWGVTYTTAINIKNEGVSSTPRYLRYSIDMGNFIGYKYKVVDADSGDIIQETVSGTKISDENEDRSDLKRTTDIEIFNIPIPAGKNYIIEVSVLNGVGTVGFEHHLKIN